MEVSSGDRLPNTLGLPSVAERVYHVQGAKDVQAALRESRSRGLPVLPLGEGSNVVLPPTLQRAVLIASDGSLERIAESGDSVVYRVGAGFGWHDLVVATVEEGAYGLENLALIPGLVGAAPVQNIGAYGRELSEFVVAVEGVHLGTGEVAQLTGDECEFAYRDSVFKHALRDRFMITSVDLRLRRRPDVEISYPVLAREFAEFDRAPTPEEVLQAVVAIRRRRLPDPAKEPNAGSFFKNPVLTLDEVDALRRLEPELPAHRQADAVRFKVPAAWLIEACDLKGFRQGAVAMAERHALVLLNLDGARQRDVLDLAAYVQERVQARFGVSLEIEPRVYGEH